MKAIILGILIILSERKIIPRGIILFLIIQFLIIPATPLFAMPQVYLSSDSLEQGDALLIKIDSQLPPKEVKGKFGSTKIKFFKLKDKAWVGMVGVSVKKKPREYNLVIDFPKGETFKKKINVAKRNFPERNLPTTKEYSVSKIKKALSKTGVTLAKIFNRKTKKVYFDKYFIYPLKEIEISGFSFGEILKRKKFSVKHLGVDLKAERGTPIYAINDGVVRLSGNLGNYGKTLIIDHGFSIFSLYSHLDELRVKKGKVKRGEIIGLSGDSGFALGPHLHLTIIVSGSSVDPLRFIEITEKELEKGDVTLLISEFEKSEIIR